VHRTVEHQQLSPGSPLHQGPPGHPGHPSRDGPQGSRERSLALPKKTAEVQQEVHRGVVRGKEQRSTSDIGQCFGLLMNVPAPESLPLLDKGQHRPTLQLLNQASLLPAEDQGPWDHRIQSDSTAAHVPWAPPCRRPLENSFHLLPFPSWMRHWLLRETEMGGDTQGHTAVKHGGTGGWEGGRGGGPLASAGGWGQGGEEEQSPGTLLQVAELQIVQRDSRAQLLPGTKPLRGLPKMGAAPTSFPLSREGGGSPKTMRALVPSPE
jgi:hypothetical protein